MTAPTRKTAASKAPIPCWTANSRTCPRTVEPALNVACSTAREISHRQRQKFPAQEIENCRIKTHGRKGQQIFLRQSGELHKDECGEHAEQNCLQQADVVFDNDLVDDHLRKHGEEQLKETDGDGEPHYLQQDDFETREKWKNPRQRWLAFRRLLECWRIIEQRCITCPLRFKFATRKLPQSERGVSDTRKLLINVVKHDPVVTLPMNDGRQRHQREIAQRDFQCARRQPKFGGGARNRF